MLFNNNDILSCWPLIFLQKSFEEKIIKIVFKVIKVSGDSVIGSTLKW